MNTIHRSERVYPTLVKARATLFFGSKLGKFKLERITKVAAWLVGELARVTADYRTLEIVDDKLRDEVIELKDYIATSQRHLNAFRHEVMRNDESHRLELEATRTAGRRLRRRGLFTGVFIGAMGAALLFLVSFLLAWAGEPWFVTAGYAVHDALVRVVTWRP